MLFPGTDRWLLGAAFRQPVILWSVGWNYAHGEPPKINLRTLGRRCRLFGPRDTEGTGDYIRVHDPTCMSPLFDGESPVAIHDVVKFEHFEHPIPLDCPCFTNDNSRGTKRLVDAVRFLASGRRVVTTSFHGAYWANLLGLPVAVWQPFSSRFHSVPKKSVNNLEELNLFLKAPITPIHGEYLHWCRQTNKSFYQRVNTLLLR
jgi:hypothetical protein